jgi:hypothetical protein
MPPFDAIYSPDVDSTFFFYLVCEAIGTAATPGPIVPASGDSEDDCGEADGI